MPRTASTDTRYLELHGGKWRASVAVPRDLHSKLGTRLKHPLGTDSLAAANRVKWPVVSKLKAIIEQARSTTGKAALVREAVELARLRSSAGSLDERSEIDDAIALRAEEISGRPVAEDDIPGVGTVPIFDGRRSEEAKQFAAIALGEATPIDLHHAQYLSRANTKRRTKADDVRALKFLMEWCATNQVTPMLRSITPRMATRFMDDLVARAEGPSPVTLKKYLSRLRQYWEWLVRREHADINPFLSVKLPIADVPHDQRERPFTRDEMVALLNGSPSPALHDLVRIGALTGARLDVIVDLKVKDVGPKSNECPHGVFHFKPQKNEKAVRAVPVHSALAKIVRRRVVGKAPGDDLFPEWPAPKKAGTERERSFKASNAFTEYRRSVGVDDRVPGKRRSLVNFHSFRRWFITEAERAGQPENIIAAVVGHRRPGMTLGLYSAGPALRQARACVMAVKLPKV
jgi:integrase